VSRLPICVVASFSVTLLVQDLVVQGLHERKYMVAMLVVSIRKKTPVSLSLSLAAGGRATPQALKLLARGRRPEY